jgi:hypothetical protein
MAIASIKPKIIGLVLPDSRIQSFYFKLMRKKRTQDKVVDRLGDQAEVLFLNLFAIATQRNDLAVLSHSFDRGPAPLLQGSPIGGNMFGASDLGEFFLELVQPTKLFHPSFNEICVHGVGRIVRHLG